METGCQNISYFGSYNLVVRCCASWNGCGGGEGNFDSLCEEYFNAAIP